MPFGLLIVFVVVSLLILPKMLKNKKYLVWYGVFLVAIICVLQPILLFFVIPIILFLFPQFLKKKKWILLYGIVMGSIIAYLFYDLQYEMSRPDYNDSFGDGLAYIFLFWAFIIVIGGSITRLITLYLGHKKYSFRVRFIVAILGFAFIALLPLFLTKH